MSGMSEWGDDVEGRGRIEEEELKIKERNWWMDCFEEIEWKKMEEKKRERREIKERLRRKERIGENE